MTLVTVVLLAIMLSSISDPNEIRILIQLMKRETRDKRTTITTSLTSKCSSEFKKIESQSEVSDIEVIISDKDCFKQLIRTSKSNPQIKGIYKDRNMYHLEQWSNRSRGMSQYRSTIHFSGTDATNTLQISDSFWKRGARGSGVKVAIFDTGIVKKHPHFRNSNIKTCVDYTNTKPSCEDGFGHGSYVAGIIAATECKCKGMLPDAELHIFKVCNLFLRDASTLLVNSYTTKTTTGLH